MLAFLLMGDFKYSKPALIILSGFCALVIGAALNPNVREFVRRHLYSSDREILATVTGDLLHDGSLAKAVKYRTRDGIFVEVFGGSADGALPLVERFSLSDRLDGLFNYQGHVTRLAIADVDDDGQMELLVPTFDSNLVPHLNIFRYSTQTKHFEPIPPP